MKLGKEARIIRGQVKPFIESMSKASSLFLYFKRIFGESSNFCCSKNTIPTCEDRSAILTAVSSYRKLPREVQNFDRGPRVCNCVALKFDNRKHKSKNGDQEWPSMVENRKCVIFIWIYVEQRQQQQHRHQQKAVQRTRASSQYRCTAGIFAHFLQSEFKFTTWKREKTNFWWMLNATAFIISGPYSGKHLR